MNAKLMLMAENTFKKCAFLEVASVEEAEKELSDWESMGGKNNEFPRAIVADMSGEPTLVATLRAL